MFWYNETEVISCSILKSQKQEARQRASRKRKLKAQRRATSPQKSKLIVLNEKGAVS
jgi:hypothetical protein